MSNRDRLDHDGFDRGQRAPRPRGRAGLIVAVVVLSLVVIGGGLYFSGALTKLTQLAQTSAAPASGEIILDPAGAVGPDPFSGESFAPAPDPQLAAPAGSESVSTAAPAGTQIVATRAETPGLYGGTRSETTCDSDQLVQFLAGNPAKAAAWVSALRQDPSVALPDGSPLTVSTIPDYVASLTSVVLQSDTRVTNHGFANGAATTFQSVLQGGTSVLVDAYGVPRARCFCGNPLRAPEPTKTTPVYRGSVWQGFSPASVGVVQKATQPITVFVLRDSKTGKLFDRAPGTNGKNDTAHAANPSASPTSASPTPAPTTSATPSAPSSTTSPQSNLSFDGKYAVTYSLLSYSGQAKKPSVSEPGTMTVSCPSSTSCNVTILGQTRTYQRSGNSLTVPSQAVTGTLQYTCRDGSKVPTAIQRTIRLLSNGNIDYRISVRASAGKSSDCPVQTTNYKGTGIRK